MDKTFLIKLYVDVLYQLNNVRKCSPNSKGAIQEYKNRLQEIKEQIKQCKGIVYNITNIMIYEMESIDSQINNKYGISNKGREAFQKLIGIV